MEVSSLCLPYGKGYFQEHQWSAFLFTAEITEILLFSGMRLLERSKITVWEQHLWKTNLQWKFWVVSALRIKVFSRGTVKRFSLYGSNESFCVVSGMPIWQRSKITVWAQSFFKNFLTMKTFVFDLVIKRSCSWYWVFFKYCEYPKYLFPNIQPKTMCRRRLLVALCCLVVRRPNLEVTIKRHLHKQVKISW